jgi:hypothetical protein
MSDMNYGKFLELIKEYFDLVEFFIARPGKYYKLDSGNIGILREHIEKVLSRYAFLEVNQKLKLYKTLNLIVTEEGLYTSRHVIMRNNEKIRERLFVINMKTYHTLNVNI